MQGWHYKWESNWRLRITRYTGSAVDIIVPAEIGGAVVSVGFDRFSPPPQYSRPEKRRHNTVIVPDGTRGAFFPSYADVRYANGGIYDGYLPAETQSAELTLVSLQGIFFRHSP